MLNSLECRDIYIATSNNIIHWPLMGGLLHFVSKEGPGRGRMQPLLAYSPLINGQCTVLLYNGPLFWDFNVPVKALMPPMGRWSIRTIIVRNNTHVCCSSLFVTVVIPVGIGNDSHSDEWCGLLWMTVTSLSVSRFTAGATCRTLL